MNALSEKRKDSVHEETLAVSAKEVIVDRKYIRALLLQLRSHRLTEEKKKKGFGPRGESPSGRKGRKPCKKNPQMKVCGPVV